MHYSLLEKLYYNKFNTLTTNVHHYDIISFIMNRKILGAMKFLSKFICGFKLVRFTTQNGYGTYTVNTS